MPPEILPTYRKVFLGVIASVFGGKPVEKGEFVNAFTAGVVVIENPATELTAVDEFPT
jgi:hypothetical protein